MRRDGLLAAIERQRHRRLLVVHALAGYGKTVLLSQWHDAVQASGAVSIWIGLERADASPEQFLASLVSGLAQAGLPPGGGAERASAIGSPEGLQALLRIAEQSTRETWLMFDDWQRIDAEPAGEMMASLLRNMPPNWHVALSSRTRPRLNLLSLLARGQLIELDQNGLRFSPDEVRALMASAPLSAGDAQALADLTEGWPIALQLARLRLEHGGDMAALQTSFLGSIDGMAEFLAAEVFAALAPELRDCLLESSICSRFTRELIDFVRERSDSTALIEALRTSTGLIFALDDGREWHRHHRILAEFLDGERRSLPAAHIAHLHSRAALWFEGRGLLSEAVEHARLSGDEARAVQLVEDAGCVDICIRTGAPAVRALLDSLPTNAVQERPRLRAAYTAMNLKLGSIGKAGELLTELQAAVAQEGPDAPLRRDLLIVQNLRQCFIDEAPQPDELAGQCRSLEAFASADWWVRGLMLNAKGRLEMRGGLLEEAVVSLSEADLVFANGGSAQGHFFMLANLAMCHLFLGRFGIAEDHLDRAQAVLKCDPSGAAAYSGILHTIEAMLLYERNELTAAGHAAHRALAGLELAEGCFEQYFSSIQVAARVAFAASGLDAALRFIDRGRRLARYHGLARMARLLDMLQLRLTIDAEQWDVAAGLAHRADAPSGARPISGWLEHDMAVPALCHIAMHDGRAGEARTLARSMVARCHAAGRRPAQIRAHIVETLAAAMLDDEKGARDALRDAVRLASGEGLVQPFFEVDGLILLMLHELQRTEAAALPPVQAEFLAGLVLRLIAAGKAKAHSEPLTGRERQILELLSQGGSNKVIARALNLTENAVKFHLKNVFRKLRVDNRAMAAQVARGLDLGVLRQTGPARQAHAVN